MKNLKRWWMLPLQKQINKTLFSAVVLVSACAFIPAVAFAVDIPLEVGVGNTKAIPDLSSYIAILYEFIVGTIAVLSAAAIMLNGVRWAAAGGNAGQIGKAKEGIISAIAALVIAVGSFIFLNALNPNLTSISFITPRPPNVPKGEATETSEIPNTPAGNECGSTAADPICSGVVAVEIEFTEQRLSKSSMQLIPSAADAWNRMARGFYSRFGKKLPVNHMYRSYSYQQCLYDKKIGDNPSKPSIGSRGHISGAAVDINVSSLTQAEYNWLVCGDQFATTCTITGKSKSGYNITSPNGFNWKVLNYNPNKSGGKITEDHHFDYQGSSSVCQACPELDICN